jgi:hypothetical protein
MVSGKRRLSDDGEDQEMAAGASDSPRIETPGDSRRSKNKTNDTKKIPQPLAEGSEEEWKQVRILACFSLSLWTGQVFIFMFCMRFAVEIDM